jgi:hypothetical protein
MKAFLETLLFCILLLLGGACAADTPTSTPRQSAFCSPSGRYCATSTAKDSTTVVRSQYASKGSVEWSSKVFVADGYISDDGMIIASCYPGKNLVPSEADLKFVVIKFFDAKGRYQAVTLGDIYTSMDELPDTVSHKDWGRCLGFSQDGFGVEKANGTVWRVGKLFGDESLK